MKPGLLERQLTVKETCLMLCLLFSCSSVSAAVTVVTSIKPLQWMVEALLPADVHVVSLLPAGQSAHEYSLRPSDILTVQQSSLLVWIGPGMEPWLVQLTGRLPPGRSFSLLSGTGVLTASGEDEAHDHGINTDPALAADAHLWLDPVGTAERAPALARALQVRFPEHAALIEARLSVFQQRLHALHLDATTRLAPVKASPFIVYHDSYGSLVARYGLSQKAAVWRHETLTAGVRERAALLDVLRQGQVQCVFHEPEYGQEAVQGWLSPTATGIRVQELDPLGDKVNANGVDGYAEFFDALVGDIVRCLAPSQDQQPAI